ncbi:MAG: hypothetical protein JOY96_04575 [Verrucomicrobia bacterium]|nr:hypothetical protein [Verrucomicrobiota bacterium]MBV9674251.1 hypothetical protein [Verrucomicrobiota bacterium]
METALAYAGYDLAHAWGTHGHDFSVMRAILPDVLRWIWRDWPAPVRAGISGNSTLKEILVSNQSWQLVSDQFKASSGLATSPEGDLVIADGSTVYRLRAGRPPIASFVNAPVIRGQAFDKDRNSLCHSAFSEKDHYY